MVLEVAIRLFGPFLPGNYNTGRFLTPHPVYGRFHVPSFDGWVKTSEFTSRVTTNSLGLRGPERPYEKRDDSSRVLVLGDSFVEAAQVSESQGVVGRLEAGLNASATSRYEVLNGGVGGWGTGQQYVYFSTEGHRYEPDVVLVLLYLGNDVYDNSYLLQGRPRNPREPYFVLQPDGSLRPLEFRSRKPEEVNPIVGALRPWSRVWNMFESGVLEKLYDGEDPLELRLNRFNLNKMYIHGNAPPERQEDAWRVTLALLGRIRDEALARGARPALVIVPAAWQVYDGDWDELLRSNNLRRSDWSADRPNRLLAERAGEIRMPTLDLLSQLRSEAVRTPGRLYFPADKHWTSAGHAVAAREIVAFLMAEKLLGS